MGSPPPRIALRVVHLDHSREYGGAELGLIRLLAQDLSWMPVVVTPRGPGADRGVFEGLRPSVPLVSLGPAATVGASRVRGVGSLVRFGSSILRQAISLRLSGEFRQSDVIYANTSRSALYGALACIMSPRKALVLHLRDTVTSGSLGTVGAHLFRLLALKRADGIIGNSSFTLASAMIRRRRPLLQRVIPSAAGIVRAEEVQSSDVQRPARRIGMLARLDPWKGQDLLIRAFARSGLADEGVSLHLAGSGQFGLDSFATGLQDLASNLGVAQRIVFEGHIVDTTSFIERMDICVQCSTRPEPLGQNVLQYLSAGAAVIVAGEGGPAEWVADRQNGLHFEARSEVALSGALQELYRDDELRTRLARAARHTPGLMSDNEVAVATGSFLDEVAAMKNHEGAST